MEYLLGMMDRSFREAVKLASKGQTQREDAMDKGVLRILGGALIFYGIVEIVTNIQQVVMFELSLNTGEPPYSPKTPEWGALSGWQWDGNIDSADAAVIVTAVILFVASFNVAAVASAVEHERRLTTVLTKHWWSVGAGASTMVAASAAFAVAFTRFPKEPGLGAALIVLAMLTGAGSWLVAGENAAAATRLVSVASKRRQWKESEAALGRALWQRIPVPLIEKLASVSMAGGFRGQLVRSAAFVLACVLLEALGQTAWIVLALNHWAAADDAAGDWSVYSFWIYLDVFATAFPALMLVTVLILGWVAQARRKAYRKIIFIIGFIYVSLMTLSVSSSYSGFVGAMERGWSVATLVVLSGFVAIGAVKGRGPGTPVPMAVLAYLAKDELKNRKLYKRARKKYLAWAVRREAKHGGEQGDGHGQAQSLAIWHVNITPPPPSSDGYVPTRLATYRRAVRQIVGKLLP